MNARAEVARAIVRAQDDDRMAWLLLALALPETSPEAGDARKEVCKRVGDNPAVILAEGFCSP